MRSRMHAFPLPPSISHKEYSPFECVSCDHLIPFSQIVNGQVKSYSIRGYTGCIIHVNAATDMLWVYLVHNKSEWLDTLKSLVREYGPTTNAKSAKLKYLKSDFCIKRTPKFRFYKLLQKRRYPARRSTAVPHISMPKTRPSVRLAAFKVHAYQCNAAK